jgi:hypothetical protein
VDGSRRRFAEEICGIGKAQFVAESGGLAGQDQVPIIAVAPERIERARKHTTFHKR